MAKNKASKVTLEEEVNTIKKHFGGIIATVKALKETVDNLQKKLAPKERDEIQDIIDKQKALDKAIADNDAALDQIKRELLDLKDNREVPTSTVKTKGDAKYVQNEVEESINQKNRKCRYFNRGYCKYKMKCRYFHPKNVCQEYVTNQKCSNSDCIDRHPKPCKWTAQTGGCKRINGCDYLHATSVGMQTNEPQEYTCISCKDTWQNRSHVVEYGIQGVQVYFCLNCDDWVKVKPQVLEEGWTLWDGDGYLRRDV